MSGRRRVTVLLALVGLLLGVSPAFAPPASAAMFGHDISWPQCPPSEGGYGLPLPPTSTQFVIIGLTRGLAFTENPCLDDQVNWARTHRKPTQAYTLATYPTAAQLSAYGRAGPWTASTRAGQLSNVGFAEGRYAVDTLRRVGYSAHTVWIDVEPRTAQPWPGGAAAQQRQNRYLLEGMMRAFRDAGLTYGLYSYTAGWQEITGSWRLPGVPVWATAGRLDHPNEALDRCVQPSFSAGRVYISQWYDDTSDYDLTCGSYGFTRLAVPPSSLSNSTAEFDGDWNNDVLSRNPANGDLFLHRGTSRGTLAVGVRIATGWQVFNALETPGDLSGDGAADVLARERATGYLWLYRGDGRGGFLPRVRAGVGQNWNVFSAIVAPGDVTGDQRPDLLAREAATGNLWLYPGNGAGGWQPRIRVGLNWNVFSAIVGPGDVTGDGRADVLAREAATGNLWLYPGNGTGGFLPRIRVGLNWNVFSALTSPGDLNGDRVPDVLAREQATGYLWLYAGNGIGGFLPRTLVGTTWNTRDPIF
jgi:hypothetical protein